MRRALPGLVTFALGAGAALGAASQPPLQKLPSPPWDRSGPPGAKALTRLSLLSARANTITDTRAWFERNRLDFAADRVPGASGGDTPLHPLPAGTPTSFRGARLVQAIRQPGRLLLVYGRDFASGRYVVARASGRPLYAFDFVNYAHAPTVAAGEQRFVYQAPTWATERGGALLVEHAHATYARSSHGLNAYLTAVDVKTGRVQWRSRPLVANAQSFAVVKDAVVTGYGFTKEPDFVYVLDRATGAVVQRFAVPSSPEYIVAKGSRVHVRTYDHDLVFRVRTK